MAPKAALAVVLMLCCASAALATSYKCHHDHDCKAKNECQYGVCKYGKCVYKYKADHTPCKDGNYCTVGDYCKAGYCKAGKPKKCYYDPKIQCKYSKCNPKNGQCTVYDRPDGYSCNDKNKCTNYDVCKYGICSGTPKTCYNKKGDCWKTYCDKYSGECKYKQLPDGTKCDDHDAHTKDDKCHYGVCKGTKYYG